jgi:uncharacterized protein (TIGR01777 family)
MSPKVVLAGGSGFIGRALAARFAALGWEVVILTRTPVDRPGARQVAWNAETGGAWAAELEGAAAVINLAGRSIDCVHTLAHTREILDSRIHAVQALGKGCKRIKRPPAVWVQGSAVGYYGHAGEESCDEAAPAGRDFLAEVCRRWEEAFAQVELAETRRVVLRLGLVLGRGGGAYPALARLAQRFLGGAAGSGRQGISWVHRDDAVTAFVEAVRRETMTGAFNVCSPNPVANAEFMRALRRSLGRPWAPPAPAFAVRFAARHLLKTEPALILEGRRVLPARLLAAGFSFAFPTLEAALADLAPQPAYWEEIVKRKA